MGCVYIATSKTTGKSYIGMTTQPLKKRINQHETNHMFGAFSGAIRKYGRGDFIWDTLYTHESEDVLFEKEQEYIATHNTHTPNGYNITLGGRGGLGVFFSYEKKKYYSEAAKRRFPDIYCVELDTVYTSMRDAMNETGVAMATIRKSIKNPFWAMRLYHFCEYIECNVGSLKALHKLGLLHYGTVRPTEETKAKRALTMEHTKPLSGSKNPAAHPVINVTDGKEFAYIREAVAYYGLSNAANSNISSCCRGLRTTAYGYKWAYKNA